MATRRDQEADFWNFVSSFRPDTTGSGVDHNGARGGFDQFPVDMFLNLPGLQGRSDPRNNPWASYMDAFARSFGHPSRDHPSSYTQAQTEPAERQDREQSVPPASEAESSDTEGVHTPATVQADVPDPAEVVPQDNLTREDTTPRHPDTVPPLPGRRPGPGRGRAGFHRGPRSGWHQPDPFGHHPQWHHSHPHGPPRPPHHQSHGFFPFPPPPPPPGAPHDTPHDPAHDVPQDPIQDPHHDTPRRHPRAPPHNAHRGPPRHPRHGQSFPPPHWNIAGLWDRFAESFGVNPTDTSSPDADTRTDGFRPPVDVFNTDRAFVVHISLPGAKKQDVRVDWNQEQRTLKIAGVVHRPGDEEFLQSLISSERRFGYFERDVVLASEAGSRDEVDSLAVSAKMEDGILTVTLPKLEKEWTEVRSVDIE